MALPAVVLPQKFIVLVDRHNHRQIQQTLIDLGYRWRVKARPGKGTPETRSDDTPRTGPHIAINCYLDKVTRSKKWMARIHHGHRVDAIVKRDGAEVFTANEFLEKVSIPFVGVDMGTEEKKVFPAYPFFDERSRFVMKLPRHAGKTDPIFNWRNPMVKKRTQTWKFESRHAADIDFVKIAADLSYAHPFALVKPAGTKGGDEVWLVSNYKLLLKARLVDEQHGLPPDVKATVRHLLSLIERGHPVHNSRGDYVTRIPLSEVKEFVESEKLVKSLPWPEGEDKKTRTIEVTILAV